MPNLWTDPYPEFVLYPFKKFFAKKEKNFTFTDMGKRVMCLSLALGFLVLDIILKAISQGPIDVLVEFFNPFGVPQGSDVGAFESFFTPEELTAIGGVADYHVFYIIFSLTFSLLILTILKFLLLDNEKTFSLNNFCFVILGLCAGSCMGSICGMVLKQVVMSVKVFESNWVFWAITGLIGNFLLYIVFDDMSEFLFSIFLAPYLIMLVNLIPGIKIDLTDFGFITLIISIVFTFLLKIIFHFLKSWGILDFVSNWIKKWCYTFKYAWRVALFMVYFAFWIVKRAAESASDDD